MYPDSDVAYSDLAPSSSPPRHDAPLSLADPQSPLPSLPDRSGSSPARSSHSRKKKPGHIPRPPNAFLIFRSELWNKEKIKSSVERDHRQISRIAGRYWQELTDDERAPYHVLAEEAKRLHAQKYPDYKYSPVYRKDKATKRKAKPEDTGKVLRCKRVALLMRQGFEGDDLQRELERHDASGDDDTSDASDYVGVPHRKKLKPRKSSAKKASSTQRSRRPRDLPDIVKAEISRGKDGLLVEDVDSPIVDVPIPVVDVGASPVVDSPVPIDPVVSPVVLDITPKQEHSTPTIHGHGAFVPQDEIPELCLGPPAFSPKVCSVAGVPITSMLIYPRQVEFTNPFAEKSDSPRGDVAAFINCDPLNPVVSPFHSPPSSDFLGIPFDEPPAPMEASGLPDSVFDMEFFDFKGDLLRPAASGLRPDCSTMFAAEDIFGSLYIPDYTADQPGDHVYSAWVDM